MKSAILLFAALAIAAPSIATPALAQVDEAKLMAACKDKKPGDTVTVDGQEAKCK